MEEAGGFTAVNASAEQKRTFQHQKKIKTLRALRFLAALRSVERGVQQTANAAPAEPRGRGDRGWPGAEARTPLSADSRAQLIATAQPAERGSAPAPSAPAPGPRRLRSAARGGGGCGSGAGGAASGPAGAEGGGAAAESSPRPAPPPAGRLARPWRSTFRPFATRRVTWSADTR